MRFNNAVESVEGHVEYKESAAQSSRPQRL